jgi:hypothetical protein
VRIAEDQTGEIEFVSEPKDISPIRGEVLKTWIEASEAEAPSSLVPASGSTVPFNKANIDMLETATLTDGIVVECGENRWVEVWRVKEEEGYCIRIFRPTNDGKV